MARPKKPTDTLKDQRVPIMMSESELKELDDWSFEHRIRSRGEAIRRLCQLGMLASEKTHILSEEAFEILSELVEYMSARNRGQEQSFDLPKLSARLGDFFNETMDLGMKIKAVQDGEFPLEEGLEEVEWLRQNAEARPRLSDDFKEEK